MSRPRESRKRKRDLSHLIEHRPGRLPTVKGHPRTDVCSIRNLWVSCGMSAYQVTRWDPSYTRGEVQAAVDYFAAHAAELREMQRQLSEEWEREEQQRRERLRKRSAEEAELTRYVRPGKVRG